MCTAGLRWAVRRQLTPCPEELLPAAHNNCRQPIQRRDPDRQTSDAAALVVFLALTRRRMTMLGSLSQSVRNASPRHALSQIWQFGAALPVHPKSKLEHVLFGVKLCIVRKFPECGMRR